VNHKTPAVYYRDVAWNDLSACDCDGPLPDALLAVEWIEKANDSAMKQISTLDLPFAVPDVRELLLIWPQKN